MPLVSDFEQIYANAQLFADSIHDGNIPSEEASHLVSAGRVFLPFRYGERLAFAPAKFIGYENNDLETYRSNVYERNGGRARSAITRVLGYDAREDIDLELQLDNYCTSIGFPLQAHRHSFWLNEDAKKFKRRDRSAILDLDVDGIGNDDPQYRRRIAGAYFRDDKVRRAVIARAAGKCEYCGETAFRNRDGYGFLEAHHIIALSEEGRDKVSNVIALCPNHHREAHFGERWESLQNEFLTIVAKIVK